MNFLFLEIWAEVDILAMCVDVQEKCRNVEMGQSRWAGSRQRQAASSRQPVARRQRQTGSNFFGRFGERNFTIDPGCRLKLRVWHFIDLSLTSTLLDHASDMDQLQLRHAAHVQKGVFSIASVVSLSGHRQSETTSIHPPRRATSRLSLLSISTDPNSRPRTYPARPLNNRMTPSSR